MYTLASSFCLYVPYMTADNNFVLPKNNKIEKRKKKNEGNSSKGGSMEPTEMYFPLGKLLLWS